MICSDHGWTFGGYTHLGSPNGVVILAGPQIRGGVLEGARIEDIAPTTLALLGVPLSAELAGEVLVAALIRPPELRRVASYGPLPKSSSADSAVDQEEIERLRALGYIR